MSLRSEAPEEQKIFYHSSAWKKCRDAYIAKVGGLCEQCLERGIIKPGYMVHHKIHLDMENINDPSITLNHDNLEYLCFNCHQQEHFGIKKRYVVCADGSVKIRDTA